MNFLKGFLAFFLVLIIVGGLGFIGYTTFFTNHSVHSETNTKTTSAQEPSQQKDTANNNAMQNHSGMTQDSGGSQQAGNLAGLNQANIILQNKESLSKSLTVLNESLKLLTVDPYAPSTDSNTMSNTTMQNMGTVYDVNKMEKLHSGLYKISLGAALLNQLENQLTNQAETASLNTQYLAQYYTNQYNLSIQNKSKLIQALGYLNEAANLVNINPYVSANGHVYDKDRMNQIHGSIFKLAQGVASLNLLSDDFTRQSIVLSSMVQSQYNNTSSSQINHGTMPQGLFGGLFENIGIQSAISIILIIFFIGLVLGIIGFIVSQPKPINRSNIL
jgi:hypothetical protein